MSLFTIKGLTSQPHVKKHVLCMMWIVAVVVSWNAVSADESMHCLPIEIDGTNGISFKIFQRSVSEREGRDYLRRAAELDPGNPVRLMCTTNVSVAQFVAALNAVQEAGFSHIGVACPGIKNGANGIYVVTFDFTSEHVFLPAFGFEGSLRSEEFGLKDRGPAGFYPSTSQTVRAIGPLITPQATNSFMVVTNGLNGRMVNLATNAAPGK